MAESKVTAGKKAKAAAVSDSPEVEEVSRALRRHTPVDEILGNQRGRWLERHEGAVIKQTHHFGHPTSKKNFDRYFEKMSQYLFFIPVFGRAILAQRKEANVLAIEKNVHSTITKAIRHLDQRIHEAETLVKVHNLDEHTENLPIEIKVTHASPLDRLFFELLQKSDRFLLINHGLWIQGALDPADYDKNERIRTDNEWEIKRLIKNVIYGIITNHRRLMNAIRRDQQAPAETKPARVEDNTKPSDLLAAKRAAEVVPPTVPDAVPA